MFFFTERYGPCIRCISAGVLHPVDFECYPISLFLKRWQYCRSQWGVKLIVAMQCWFPCTPSLSLFFSLILSLSSFLDLLHFSLNISIYISLFIALLSLWSSLSLSSFSLFLSLFISLSSSLSFLSSSPLSLSLRLILCLPLDLALNRRTYSYMLSVIHTICSN